MKDLIFNELTEFPLAKDFTDAILRIEQFLQTFKTRPENVFDRGIRLDKHIGEIMLTDKVSVQDLVSQQGRARTLGSALLSLGRFPYIKEGSAEEEQYILNEYLLVKQDSHIAVIGLAAAYLQNSVAIGFESEPFWQNCVFPLSITDPPGSESTATVFSVSTPDHFSAPDMVQWIEAHTDLELLASTFSPKDKHIHLRQDHGIDILKTFALKIVRSPYVNSVVNSCEFSPHNRQFIRSASEHGIVEITLPWTEQGLGMAIQTTGRNKRETIRIAEILREEYS